MHKISSKNLMYPKTLKSNVHKNLKVECKSSNVLTQVLAILQALSVCIFENEIFHRLSILLHILNQELIYQHGLFCFCCIWSTSIGLC